jgi:hypothetical protein
MALAFVGDTPEEATTYSYESWQKKLEERTWNIHEITNPNG